MLYTKDEIRNMLPNVGDTRMEIPTETGREGLPAEPMECQVIEVNPDHMWYRVRFKDTGFTECYKLPKVTWRPFGGAIK